MKLFDKFVALFSDQQKERKLMITCMEGIIFDLQRVQYSLDILIRRMDNSNVPALRRIDPRDIAHFREVPTNVPR